jgi:hypothetical protein
VGEGHGRRTDAGRKRGRPCHHGATRSDYGDVFLLHDVFLLYHLFGGHHAACIASFIAYILEKKKCSFEYKIEGKK